MRSRKLEALTYEWREQSGNKLQFIHFILSLKQDIQVFKWEYKCCSGVKKKKKLLKRNSYVSGMGRRLPKQLNLK